MLVQVNKAQVKRRTSHEPNKQIRKTLCSPLLAFDSAHVKWAFDPGLNYRNNKKYMTGELLGETKFPFKEGKFHVFRWPKRNEENRRRPFFFDFHIITSLKRFGNFIKQI